MNSALAAVLSNPAIWRGGECAPEPAALPSGFAALDDMLPGQGWPGNALTEIVLEREGIAAGSGAQSPPRQIAGFDSTAASAGFIAR